MLKNKTGNMVPYQLPKKVKRQNPFLLGLIWIVSYIMAGGRKCKIEKHGMEGVKPPYLLLSEHQGFPDYYLTPLALFPHRATYVSDIEGFAAYGKWFYSQLGCIGTRRFVHGVGLVKALLQVLNENKDIAVIYPEACHSSVGTNKPLPLAVGKLVKSAGVPVVIQKLHGSYLTNPVWDETHSRKVPFSISMHKILDPKELAQMSAAQVTEIVNEHFAYDEYRWQYENKIKISYPKRAEGLHRVLYQCPSCQAEYTIHSRGATLHCTKCKKIWEMDEYGRLNGQPGKTEFPHIPDWYEWQRRVVQKQIDHNSYQFREPVRVEALPSEKGFVPLGKGILEQSAKGFLLNLERNDESIFFHGRYSLHVEYDYRERGDCIVLSTRDCCYYIYPESTTCNVTKAQFAAEYYSWSKGVTGQKQ